MYIQFFFFSFLSLFVATSQAQEVIPNIQVTIDSGLFSNGRTGVKIDCVAKQPMQYTARLAWKVPNPAVEKPLPDLDVRTDVHSRGRMMISRMVPYEHAGYDDNNALTNWFGISITAEVYQPDRVMFSISFPRHTIDQLRTRMEKFIVIVEAQYQNGKVFVVHRSVMLKGMPTSGEVPQAPPVRPKAPEKKKIP